MWLINYIVLESTSTSLVIRFDALCADFFSEESLIWICNSYLISTLRWPGQLQVFQIKDRLHPIKNRKHLFVHTWFHGCWWHIDVKETAAMVLIVSAESYGHCGWLVCFPFRMFRFIITTCLEYLSILTKSCWIEARQCVKICNYCTDMCQCTQSQYNSKTQWQGIPSVNILPITQLNPFCG